MQTFRSAEGHGQFLRKRICCVLEGNIGGGVTEELNGREKAEDETFYSDW